MLTPSPIQISVDTPIESVFISYDSQTGVEFAREARALCANEGVQAWVWEIDRAPGGYPIKQIATEIERCAVFFYLCTVSGDSLTSLGQEYERNLALNLNKPVRILTADENFVPVELKAFTYVKFSVDTFSSVCQEVISQLSTSPTVTEPAKVLAEEQKIDIEG